MQFDKTDFPNQQYSPDQDKDCTSDAILRRNSDPTTLATTNNQSDSEVKERKNNVG